MITDGEHVELVIANVLLLSLKVESKERSDSTWTIEKQTAF